MDIEKLTKSQIILLTLLVSFVTSIATGIVTVSLMDQAPPVVAQTLNRVIERTVEKVVQSDQTAAAAVTTEKTVIVKESELISTAVARVAPSIVRLYAGPADAPEYIGLGLVLSKAGLIIADYGTLPGATTPVYADNDGQLLFVSILSRERDTSLALLQGATSTSAGPVTWKPAMIGSGPLVLGQVVVTLAGRTSTRIDDGIVSTLPGGGSPKNVIDTNLSASAIHAGSPLFNTDGEVVGLSTSASRGVSSGGFIASSALLEHISALGK